MIGSGISYANVKMVNKKARYQCSECGQKWTTAENAQECHNREVVV
jgi:transcriptional regulator NrdR family protein